MIVAVLDANTIVSGMIAFREGSTPPATLFRAWRGNRFNMAISSHILDEVERTLMKPYFAGHPDRDIYPEMVATIRTYASFHAIDKIVPGIASHPEDDLVLATAVSGHAHYLVTGDKQLLSLEHYEGVKIVSPREFLTMLDQAQSAE